MSVKTRTSRTPLGWVLTIIFAGMATSSHAGLLVSTLNSTYMGAIGGRIDGSYKHAAQFSTDATAYALTGATAVIESNSTINASLFSDSGGLPGVQVFAFDSHAANGSSYAPVSFSVSSSFTLQPNTTYHLVLNSPGGSPASWVEADTSFVVAGVGNGSPGERIFRR